MKNKKYIALLVLLVLSSLTLITGSSYAILKGSEMSDKEHMITTGNVSVKLVEKYENIDKGINTENDVKAILNNEYYEFSVTNTGDAKVKYKVLLENKPLEGYTGKLIPIEYVRVGLEVDGNEIGPIGLDISKGVIDENKLDLNQAVNYKMRLWFDENKKSELKNMKDANVFLKIKIVAEQIVE